MKFDNLLRDASLTPTQLVREMGLSTNLDADNESSKYFTVVKNICILCVFMFLKGGMSFSLTVHP